MSICAKEAQVLLIDQHDFRRASFVSILEDWAHSSETCVEAVTPKGAATDLDRLPSYRLVLLSLGSRSIDAEGTRKLLKLLNTVIPDTPVAIVSDNTESREIAGAFKLGARGFIPTSLNPTVALKAFTFIMQGGAYFPPSALLEKVEPFKNGPDSDGGQFCEVACSAVESESCTHCNETHLGHNRFVRLTTKQQEVLEQVRDGKSNKVIAGALDMSEATVKVHVRQIMRKLGAANRTQAAVYAVEADLHDAPGSNGQRPTA